MSPPIAIIGGGPSGLTTARLLECNSIDYIVYERDTSPANEQQGGSLDIHGSTGQQALKGAGLFDKFQKHARWDATRTLLLDKSGTTRLVFGEERDAPEIDRMALRKLLLESIPAHKIRWGHAVSMVERSANGDVMIKFKNGSSASGFKLIVGADGAWSKVRHLLTPAKLVYSGKHYLEAKITAQNPLHGMVADMVGLGTLVALGDGKQISMQRQGDGSYRIYLGLSIAEDLATEKGRIDLSTDDGAVARRLFVSEVDFFADWAPELKDVVANSEGAFRAWPLYHLPSDALSWGRRSGVVLVGDAAHLSTPFVGEGVNCSMYDSLVLVDKIAEYGLDRLEEAVADYEEDMFRRGKDLIDRSNGSGALLFAQDAPASLLEVIARGAA